MVAETTTRRVIEVDVKTSRDTLAALKAQTAHMAALEKQAKNTQDAIKNFAGSIASAFSFREAVGAIRGMINNIDELGKTATSLGVSAETLSSWNYAAEQSGATAKDMEQAIKGLSGQLQNISTSSNHATKALKSFGVQAGDDMDTALTKIAEAFSKMKDGPEKTALAIDIFGRSAGPKLIPLLNEGAKGIEEFKKQAKDLGVVISTDLVAQTTAFNDNLSKISSTFRGMGISFVEGLMPALTALSKHLSETKGKTDEFKEAGRGIGEALIVGVKAINYTVASIRTLTTTYAAYFEVIEKVSKGKFVGAWDAFQNGKQSAKDFFAEASKANEALEKLFENEKKAAQEGKKGGSGGGNDAPGTTPKAPKIDKDVQALERFTKATRDAAQETKELTYAQQLDYLVQSGQIKISTEKEKALLKEAEASAKMADLAKKQRAEEKADIKAAEEANEKQDKEREKTKQFIEQMKDLADPTRTIVRQMEALDKVIENTFDEDALKLLRKAAFILRGEFTLALGTAKRGVDDVHDGLEKLGQTLKHEIEGYSKDAANALVEFATTGKQTVGEMINSILSDLAKLVVKQALDPVFKQFATFVQKGFEPSAHGNVFTPSGLTAFASGGVVSGPTVFGMSGGGAGLMGEAGPEAIVPLKRTTTGDLGVQASPVNVTVINNSSANIKTEESKGAMGEREIMIMVNSAVEEGIGRGRFDRVMSTTYGVSRRGR